MKFVKQQWTDRSGQYAPPNELVTGRNMAQSPAQSVVLCHCGGTTQTWLITLNWGHPHNWEGKWKHWKCENNMKVKQRYRLTRRLATANNISIHNEITNFVIPTRPSPSIGEHITDPVESYFSLVVNLQKSGCVYVIPCWYMMGSQKFGQKKSSRVTMRCSTVKRMCLFCMSNAIVLHLVARG